MLRRIAGTAKRYVYNMVDNPAIILLYHRVTRLDADPQELSVSPGNFFEHLDILKKKYRILEVEEFADLLIRRKKFPKRSVLLTFDDGYADNFHEALPILESHSAQALFYIATELLDTNKEFWWDELERILLGKDFSSSTLEVVVKAETFVFDVSALQQRRRAYDTLHPHLKYSAPFERDKLLDTLRTACGISAQGRPTHRVMTKEEVRKLASSSSAVIGAHTHRHPTLSVISYREQAEEIVRSRDILQQIARAKIHHFSYPFGSKKDYDHGTVKICKESEFKMVSSNYYGQVHRWSDRLQLPRILVRDWDIGVFSKQLKTFFTS
jgi:peptidoglycan/xylan/chitin deacetylase (PgdA/CDA1 family)